MKLAVILERCDPVASGPGGDPGPQRWHLALLRQLVQRGHEVHLLAARCDEPHLLPSPSPDAPPKAGVTLHVMPGKTYYGGTRQLRKFAAWASMQVPRLHVDVSLSTSALIPAQVLHTWAAPVQWGGDGFGGMLRSMRTWLSPRSRTLARMQRTTLADLRLQRVVTVTDEMAGGFEASDPHLAPKLAHLPLAGTLSPQELHDAEAARRRVREGFHVPAENTLFVLNVIDAQRQSILTVMRAFAAMVVQSPHVTLMLAGETCYAHQAQAAALGIRERVRILAATRHPGDVLAAADVILAPASAPTLNHAVVDALTLGRPVVTASPVKVLAALIGLDSAAAGLLIDQHQSVEAWRDAMAAMTSITLRERMAKRAAEVGAGLSMARHVAELEDLLHVVVAERHPGTKKTPTM